MRWGLSNGIEKRCIDAAIGKGSDVLRESLFDPFWAGARLHQSRLKLTQSGGHTFQSSGAARGVGGHVANHPSLMALAAALLDHSVFAPRRHHQAEADAEVERVPKIPFGNVSNLLQPSEQGWSCPAGDVDARSAALR